MQANSLIKTLLHLVAAFMSIGFVWWQGQWSAFYLLLLLASVAMVAVAFLHNRLLRQFNLKTSLFFLCESIVLSLIAWQLFQTGKHKATFLYEGVGVFYLSLAAFSFLLRRKRHVILSEEEFSA